LNKTLNRTFFVQNHNKLRKAGYTEKRDYLDSQINSLSLVWFEFKWSLLSDFSYTDVEGYISNTETHSGPENAAMMK
jgi:hypothetical protein